MAFPKESCNTMDTPWICLSCRWRGRFGEMIARTVMHCPSCGSNWVAIADGGVYSTPVWEGDVPKRLN